MIFIVRCEKCNHVNGYINDDVVRSNVVCFCECHEIPAAEQSRAGDKCPHCQHGLIVLQDKSIIDCIACGSTGIRR